MKKRNIENIVIPAFGGETGNCDAEKIAKITYLAYEDSANKPNGLDWEYAKELVERIENL